MKRRIILAGVLGAAAMVGGALFPLVMAMFAPENATGLGAPLLAAPTTIVVASVLMVLPGAVGLYLAHGETFGRIGDLATGLLVLGLVLVAAAAAAESMFGETGWLAAQGLLLVGSVGAGLVTARTSTLSHARTGGVLLAVSVVALLGVAPAMAALGLGLPNLLVVLLATGPTGLAWLVLGYDMLTLQDLSIQPTRVHPSEE